MRRASALADDTLAEALVDAVAASVDTSKPVFGVHRGLTATVDLQSGEQTPGAYGKDLKRASAHFQGLVNRIAYVGQGEPERLLAWADEAEIRADDQVSKRDRATLWVLKGRLLAKLGRSREATETFQRALIVYPHPDNAAWKELQISRAGITSRDEMSGAAEDQGAWPGVHPVQAPWFLVTPAAST